MTGTAARMRALLAPLEPEYLDVHDDSAAHAGHAGAAEGGGHYDLVIVAAAFRGMTPVARHRAVYALLGELMGRHIHALAIKALTPEEFA